MELRRDLSLKSLTMAVVSTHALSSRGTTTPAATSR